MLIGRVSFVNEELTQKAGIIKSCPLNHALNESQKTAMKRPVLTTD